MLRGLLVDGCWIEELSRVKEEVHQFFKKRFEGVIPKIDGVRFQVIGQHQNDFLVVCFHEKEVKDVVWECGSEKSLGLDGLNFKFIKELEG